MADEDLIRVNRAPVLTLWSSVVAEAQGHDRALALTLGKAVAGLNAQSKGRSLRIFGPPLADADAGGRAPKSGLGEERWVVLLGRGVPVRDTEAGTRAVVKDKPLDPVAVEAYLRRAFGDRLEDATAAMASLAGSLDASQLQDLAYGLYERFRPEVPKGRSGWGAKGDLDLSIVRALGAQAGDNSSSRSGHAAG